MKQNTEEAVRADLEATVRTDTVHRTAAANHAKLIAAHTAADSDAKSFIATAKAVLGHFFGRQWSAAWMPAGFHDRSLAIPSTAAGRHQLLERLHTYLEAHPDKQDALNFTGARAGEVLTALKSARAAVPASKSSVRGAKIARDKAEEALRTRMLGLIWELRQLLDDDDPKWKSFGLNPPGAPTTPDVPTDLVLTPGTPGIVHAKWKLANRATRYRVYKKEEGDENFEPAVTTADLKITIEGLKSGGTAQIQVSAANNAGESKPCAPVEIVVPAALSQHA